MSQSHSSDSTGKGRGGRFAGVAAMALLAGIAGMYLLARYQVQKKLHSFSPGASISFQEVRPSRDHGLYFTFHVHGHEYSYGYWRLFPLGQIDFSK